MECEYLHCRQSAVVRIVVPKHRPEMALCRKHAIEMIEWAQPYRAHPGTVSVETINDYK